MNKTKRILAAAALLLLAAAAFAQDEGRFAGVLGKLSFSLNTSVLEDGARTDFSLGYGYMPSIEGELRLRYAKESYNDSMYDLEESLTANDERTFEVFLLPFRYIFSRGPNLSFSAAGGVYYEYNDLKTRGYFNYPDPDIGLTMYDNNFSMHMLGPLLEAGLRFRAGIADIKLDAGIVPIFYLRRDQSMRMKPLLGADYFDYSQNTSGSPYFYGGLSGLFFRFLSLSFLYEYARIDYDAIAIDESGWTTLEEQLVSMSFKVEASVLLRLGRDFAIRAGYGHSFDTLKLDSSTPVRDDKHYFIIGSEKIAF
jgi:hypothetical protein